MDLVELQLLRTDSGYALTDSIRRLGSTQTIHIRFHNSYTSALSLDLEMSRRLVLLDLVADSVLLLHLVAGLIVAHQ